MEQTASGLILMFDLSSAASRKPALRVEAIPTHCNPRLDRNAARIAAIGKPAPRDKTVIALACHVARELHRPRQSEIAV